MVLLPQVLGLTGGHGEGCRLVQCKFYKQECLQVCQEEEPNPWVDGQNTEVSHYERASTISLDDDRFIRSLDREEIEAKGQDFWADWPEQTRESSLVGKIR